MHTKNDKHYIRAVAKAKRTHEKQSNAQNAYDTEKRQNKRKWNAEQMYELEDPALAKRQETTSARPMALVLDELRRTEDSRLVYTDILARGFYNEEAETREAYQAKRDQCELWPWQKEVVHFIEKRENDETNIGCRSLMLCLDMGLGKTIISLSHLLADNQRCCRQTGRRFNGCTLIVCQNALLVANWLDEVRQKWPTNTFQYHRLYSSKNRLISRFYIENRCDFLIVTYATIKTAYRYATQDNEEQEEVEDEGDNEEDESVDERQYIYDVLYNTQWKRVLADEYHVCVNRNSLLYRAMIALKSNIKWVITGTPIQNSLSDICSSFNFIGILLGSSLESLLDKKELIGSTTHSQLIDKIRETLDVVMIRRLKHEIPSPHHALMTKPFFMPVVKTVKLIEFETIQERALYYLYATYGSRRWRNILPLSQRDAEEKTTKTSAASILQLMMQLCLGARIVDNLVLPHGLLTMPSPSDAPELSLRDTSFREALFKQNYEYPSNEQTIEYFASLLSQKTVFTYKSDANLLNLPAEYHIEYHDRLGSEAITDLSCLEAQQNAETFVWDPFVHSDAFDLEHNEHDRVRYRLLYEHLRATGQDDAKLRTIAQECEDSQALTMIDHLMARTLKRGQYSSKNRHIIDYIQKTQTDDKVLIFSNSVRWLETMAYDLNEQNITYVLVSGKTHRVNAERITRYKNPCAKIKVLLLSFKLGNVGINIPEANIIIFADPWWNPNLLEQAESRVQRPGQTKIVQIVYFILNRTIDLYVLNRAYDKKYMTKSLMSTKEDEAQHLAQYAYNLYEYNVEQ